MMTQSHARDVVVRFDGAVVRKHRRWWVCSAWLMLSCSLLSCVSCSAKSVTEPMGTETGNPPLIDSERIEVVATEDGVRVVGAPGAAPADADVHVENTRTGQSADDTAARDGSFEVELDGEVTDEFRVSSAGSESVTVDITEVMDAGSNPQASLETQVPLSDAQCEAGRRALSDQAWALVEGEPANCESDADCFVTSSVMAHCPSQECVMGGLRTIATSTDAYERVNDELDALDAHCPADCAFAVVGCTPPFLETACLDGICRGLSMEEVCTVGVPRLDNALDEIAASVDTSCETHADCTRVTIGSECPSTRCPQSMPIARADQERVEASLLEVETTTCEGLQLQNAGCDIEAPSCEPQEPWVPECKAGECTQVSSCDSIAAWLTQQTTDLANSVDRSCTVDEDCYVVRFQTACNRSCSEAAVSAQGRSDFDTLMAEFEPTACAEFELSGCNLQEQSCTLLDPLLACVQGSCVNQ